MLLDVIRFHAFGCLLIKYLVWETVQGNAFGSKIGSESRSRPFCCPPADACGAIGMVPWEFKIPRWNFEASRRKQVFGHLDLEKRDVAG
jgi:hypothetical protein